MSKFVERHLVALGYPLTTFVRLCFIRSAIHTLITAFAIRSDKLKTCSTVYVSFLLRPRYLTPTVYTSSTTRAKDIFGFGFSLLGPLPPDAESCGATFNFPRIFFMRLFARETS